MFCVCVCMCLLVVVVGLLCFSNSKTQKMETRKKLLFSSIIIITNLWIFFYFIFFTLQCKSFIQIFVWEIHEMYFWNACVGVDKCKNKHLYSRSNSMFVCVCVFQPIVVINVILVFDKVEIEWTKKFLLLSIFQNIYLFDFLFLYVFFPICCSSITINSHTATGVCNAEKKREAYSCVCREIHCYDQCLNC